MVESCSNIHKTEALCGFSKKQQLMQRDELQPKAQPSSDFVKHSVNSV